MADIQRIGLIGCVKQKRDRPSFARDLYDPSPLFRGRRQYVEASCDRWFILSALHGLVDPDALLSPYDQTLATAPAAVRRRWSTEVVTELKRRFDQVQGLTFEIHAGSAYRDNGVVEGLIGMGADVVVPTEGMGIGEQLAFYGRRRAGSD